MRDAAVFEAPRQVAVRRVDAPALQPEEVRIRVDGCGVCGSDLAVWQGRDWFQYPMQPGAPGHEAWGLVEEVGSHVQDLAPGQSVTGLFQGAFADQATAPAAHVLPVPADLADRPLPAEAVACAVNAAGRGDIRPSDRVAVIGIGFMGALIVQMARAAGAHVTAVSRRSFACDVGTRAGAHASVQAATKEDAGDVPNVEDGFDVVFEATGQQASLDLATELVRIRGRLVVAGYHQDPRMVNMQQWNWKGLDVINAHERDPDRYLDGMTRAMAAMSAGDLDVRPLITHEFDLAQTKEAFTAMEAREDGFLKGVVRP